MKVRVTEGVLQDDAKQVPSGEECVEKEELMGKEKEKEKEKVLVEKEKEMMNTEASLEKEEERLLRVASEMSHIDSIVLFETSVSRRHSPDPFPSNKQISLPLSTRFVTLLSSSHR